ncbi:zinc finger protein [Colletotrichum sojae]|uniref:Zinc finger protein n=1 Tax=Colletotrichum sojae TaxID=2175907 RepID=A0A8H6N458_9PEZI|nr:zinc finger protein [Colletotrichum sojae]
MHLKSSVHRQTGISCPFCGVERGTATGLVHHLERGACPKAPVDRDALYLAVRRRDPNGIISKKLLEFHGSPSYTATENSYNWYHDAYQCYLCNNLYSKLSSLNQHLSSLAHQQNLYHCPNRQCGREFTTLAATMNHLESEKCGFMRFADVQQNVGRILDPRRMIRF